MWYIFRQILFILPLWKRAISITPTYSTWPRTPRGSWCEHLAFSELPFSRSRLSRAQHAVQSAVSKGPTPRQIGVQQDKYLSTKNLHKSLVLAANKHQPLCRSHSPKNSKTCKQVTILSITYATNKCHDRFLTDPIVGLVGPRVPQQLLNAINRARKTLCLASNSPSHGIRIVSITMDGLSPTHGSMNFYVRSSSRRTTPSKLPTRSILSMQCHALSSAVKSATFAFALLATPVTFLKTACSIRKVCAFSQSVMMRRTSCEPNPLKSKWII